MDNNKQAQYQSGFPNQFFQFPNFNLLPQESQYQKPLPQMQFMRPYDSQPQPTRNEKMEYDDYGDFQYQNFQSYNDFKDPPLSMMPSQNQENCKKNQLKQYFQVYQFMDGVDNYIAETDFPKQQMNQQFEMRPQNKLNDPDYQSFKNYENAQQNNLYPLIINQKREEMDFMPPQSIPTYSTNNIQENLPSTRQIDDYMNNFYRTSQQPAAPPPQPPYYAVSEAMPFQLLIQMPNLHRNTPQQQFIQTNGQTFIAPPPPQFMPIPQKSYSSLIQQYQPMPIQKLSQQYFLENNPMMQQQNPAQIVQFQQQFQDKKKDDHVNYLGKLMPELKPLQDIWRSKPLTTQQLQTPTVNLMTLPPPPSQSPCNNNQQETFTFLPNQRTLKQFVLDTQNGPFSINNIKKTDTFLLKFLQLNNLKRIKDGLTKEVIAYFSTMNIDDLMSFQLKTQLAQKQTEQNKLKDLNSRKIGTLTYKERQQKIAKYKLKKRNRHWEKRINYDCRKQVADKRERVKGRFVPKDQENKLQYFKQIKKNEENQSNNKSQIESQSENIISSSNYKEESIQSRQLEKKNKLPDSEIPLKNCTFS